MKLRHVWITAYGTLLAGVSERNGSAYGAGFETFKVRFVRSTMTGEGDENDVASMAR
jgi:acetyltransferase-like isoleucine patch superfamily enzyme